MEKSGNKLIRFFLLGIIVWAALMMALPSPVQAQATDYNLLAPIPILEKSAGKTDTATYIPGLVKLIIGIASALAMIYIIYGGIKYMTTDAFMGKSEAKGVIWNAIWGLILAIGAWTLLNTLNPKLLNFELDIPQEGSQAALNSPNITGPYIGSQETETQGPIVPGPTIGNAWPSDASIRTSLGSNISVNKANCAKVGDTNCTSVTDLSSTIVSGVKTLAKNCNCNIRITGGTEYWLHGNKSTEIENNRTDHKPAANGGKAVDLGDNEVSSFIRKNGTKTTSDACSNLGTDKYVYGGGLYVYETKNVNAFHWHVCY